MSTVQVNKTELRKSIFPNCMINGNDSYAFNCETNMSELVEKGTEVCFLCYIFFDDAYDLLALKTVQEMLKFEYHSVVVFRAFDLYKGELLSNNEDCLSLPLFNSILKYSDVTDRTLLNNFPSLLTSYLDMKSSKHDLKNKFINVATGQITRDVSNYFTVIRVIGLKSQNDSIYFHFDCFNYKNEGDDDFDDGYDCYDNYNCYDDYDVWLFSIPPTNLSEEEIKSKLSNGFYRAMTSNVSIVE